MHLVPCATLQMCHACFEIAKDRKDGGVCSTISLWPISKWHEVSYTHTQTWKYLSMFLNGDIHSLCWLRNKGQNSHKWIAVRGCEHGRSRKRYNCCEKNDTDICSVVSYINLHQFYS
jgi:hypothetical protein